MSKELQNQPPVEDDLMGRIHGRRREYRNPALQQLRIVYMDDVVFIGISPLILDHVQKLHDRGGEACYLLDEVISAWRDDCVNKEENTK